MRRGVQGTRHVSEARASPHVQTVSRPATGPSQTATTAGTGQVFRLHSVRCVTCHTLKIDYSGIRSGRFAPGTQHVATPESLGEVIAERVCDLRRAGHQRRPGDRAAWAVPYAPPARRPAIPGGARSASPAPASIWKSRSPARTRCRRCCSRSSSPPTSCLTEAQSLGARLDWLGEPERKVLPDQGRSGTPDNAFTALLDRLARNPANAIDARDARPAAQHRAPHPPAARGGDRRTTAPALSQGLIAGARDPSNRLQSRSRREWPSHRAKGGQIVSGPRALSDLASAQAERGLDDDDRADGDASAYRRQAPWQAVLARSPAGGRRHL